MTRRTHGFALIIALCALVTFPAASQASPINPAQKAATPNASSPTIPTFPDSEQGLRDLLMQVAMLVKRGDMTALAPYLSSMELPHPNQWFRSIYGDEAGSQLAPYYVKLWPALRTNLFESLRDLANISRKGLELWTYPAKCQNPLPKVWLNNSHSNYRQTAHWVLFRAGKHLRLIGGFIYSQGAFRYLGQGAQFLKGVGATGPVLVRYVPPRYPDTQSGGLNGGAKVMLTGTIEKNGTVDNLAPIGPNSAFFLAAAESAVRKWRYKPGLLAGKPVAFQSCITVTFSPIGP
jgi:hypothetical protein